MLHHQPSLPRRAFLQGKFLQRLKTEQQKMQGYQPIRPPWAKLNEFLEKCTACDHCLTACETQIIIKGKDGLPEIDFTRGECTFCQRCVESCTEQLFRCTEEIPWLHKVEIQDSCLLTKKIECRSCGDSCESRAIRFRPQLGGIVALLLNSDSCNGCGACLSVCPTQAIHILDMK
ncbi:ferredoxin-type protein NapF [Lonepinella sp. BR2474]|uniref:ferredoxin-type protein NapF n=1 Tax=Lonepinella sp. BR2474 TaxID=3434548 RepID=UPI003F6DCF71